MNDRRVFTKPCRYCDAVLRFIDSAEKRKPMPVLAEPIRRAGSEALQKGRYMDLKGNLYTESEAPNGVDLYRAHWSDCPGMNRVKQGKLYQERTPQ